MIFDDLFVPCGFVLMRFWIFEVSVQGERVCLNYGKVWGVFGNLIGGRLGLLLLV